MWHNLLITLKCLLECKKKEKEYHKPLALSSDFIVTFLSLTFLELTHFMIVL